MTLTADIRTEDSNVREELECIYRCVGVCAWGRYWGL